MSKYRFIGAGERILPWTTNGARVVAAGDVIEVPNNSLDGHPDWEAAEESAEPTSKEVSDSREAEVVARANGVEPEPEQAEEPAPAPRGRRNTPPATETDA